MDYKIKPESRMMTYGYNPTWSEGAIKCPIFQTSTFVFNTAQEGKAFFEVAYGKRDKNPDEKLGLIYSRINNPDLEILENRLCLWDEAEECAVFESGMSAITTVLLEFLKPGDLLLYSRPVYGGTDHFIHHFLDKIGVKSIEFYPHETTEQIMNKVQQSGHANQLAMIYAETPANPTNDLISFQSIQHIAKHYSTPEKKTLIAVDNTYMGPIWQHPLKHGADLVMYSATKYIGGHSDVIAGAVLGNKELMLRVKTLRTFLGNMAGPWTGWLLLRSLETLKVRMMQQQENAKHVANFLINHPKINKVYYLGNLEKGTKAEQIFNEQCEGTGAMISFDVMGGEKQAFTVLNNLKIIKLAVSLGSTESLAQHPKTMTHCAIDEAEQEMLNITDQLIRLSVGVEHYDDIIYDLDQALSKI